MIARIAGSSRTRARPTRSPSRTAVLSVATLVSPPESRATTIAIGNCRPEFVAAVRLILEHAKHPGGYQERIFLVDPARWHAAMAGFDHDGNAQGLKGGFQCLGNFSGPALLDLQASRDGLFLRRARLFARL